MKRKQFLSTRQVPNLEILGILDAQGETGGRALRSGSRSELMVREPPEPGLGWRKPCSPPGRKGESEKVRLLTASPTSSSGSGSAGSKRVWLKEQKERTRKNSINPPNSYSEVKD